MKLAVDLHIHTALSPCGDEAMTPNNIIGMSLLKGLDAIAITDHNSVENCEACLEIAHKKDIVVIPGMEVQTKEEVHLICLFRDMASAFDFQSLIYERLTHKENLPQIFGRQLVFNVRDEIIKENTKMLISSANISVNEVFDKMHKVKGVVIPAHVDKSVYSIIANLGFIPMDLAIKTLEISKLCNVEQMEKKYKNLNKYQLIRNSDAHYLRDILERESFIEVKDKTIDSILNALKC
ncbi:PHP domain-containing protein [Clostridiaceae bacterium 35-E11]